MSGRALYLWQNMPAIHQEALVRHLCEDFTVTLIAEHALTPARRAMGWSDPDFGKAAVVVAPSRDERLEILDRQGPDAVHIFSGLRAYPETSWTLKKARSSSIGTIGLYMEPWNPGGRLGPPRELLYRTYAARNARHVDFVLATGPTAVQQYSSTRFGSRRVFEFGYFLDPNDAIPGPGPGHNSAVRFAFVGSVDARKRLGFLIEALGRVTCPDWHLTVLGDGPETESCRDQSVHVGIAERIDWRGSVSNAGVREELRGVDVLILPSRFDGWGAVVNEALHAGCRVICSDVVGARGLVESARAGFAFPVKEMSALAALVDGECRRGPISQPGRHELQDWAAHSISASVAAKYLGDIVRHVCADEVRPLPPWRRVHNVGGSFG